VHECAAVGLANEHGQEDIKLFVVRKDEDLTEADISIH
jgi:acyl-coenzyme A synthetase/AMP-(fatty) acid ligase